jgi:hypothetical protein
MDGFAGRLSDALGSTVQIAQVISDILAAPVDPENLKPMDAPRMFPAGHPVIIVGRQPFVDVPSAAAGEPMHRQENVWFAPVGGGKIFMASTQDYGDMFRGLSNVQPFTLPLQIQKAIAALRLKLRRPWRL